MISRCISGLKVIQLYEKLNFEQKNKKTKKVGKSHQSLIQMIYEWQVIPKAHVLLS